MSGESKFVVKCPHCGHGTESDECDEVIEFARKHEEHTGHRVDWKRADFDIDIEAGDGWVVECSTCSDRWNFATQDNAEEFKSEHTEFAGHPPDVVREEYDSQVEQMDLKRVVDQLEPVFEGGVPKEAIEQAINNPVFDQDRIEEELLELGAEGEVYEATIGRYRTA